MAPAWMTPLRWPHLPNRPANSILGTWGACHQNGVREHAMKPSKSLIVAAHSSSVHALRISSPTSRVSPFDRFLILAAVVRFPPGCRVSPTSPSVRPPHGSIGARCRGHNPRKAYRLSDRLRIDAEGLPGPLAGMDPVNSQRDPITTWLCPVASGCAGLRTRASLIWQGTAVVGKRRPRRDCSAHIYEAQRDLVMPSYNWVRWLAYSR